MYFLTWVSDVSMQRGDGLAWVGGARIATEGAYHRETVAVSATLREAEKTG